jgi:hypothetical protein
VGVFFLEKKRYKNRYKKGRYGGTFERVSSAKGVFASSSTKSADEVCPAGQRFYETG